MNIFITQAMKENNEIYSDSYLIKKIRDDDVRSFDILFARYSKKIYGFAFRYLKSDVDSEGVVQDVFMYIWNNREKLRADTSIKSYLFTISVNIIKKIFRRESYHAKFVSDAGGLQAEYSMEEQLEYASLLEEVDKLIDDLPERRRNIFIKSRKMGMSSKEIAEELGITPGAVDNQISEALKFLRKRIDAGMLGVMLFFVFL